MSPSRYGEPDEEIPDEHPPDEVEHPKGCRKGWLSPPDADVMVPCLVCRPWLAPKLLVRDIGQ